MASPCPALLCASLLLTTAAPVRAAQPRDPEALAAWLSAQAAKHPQHARLVVLGRSHEGRPLLALVLGRREPRAQSKPAVLLLGAHHGAELLSIDFVLDAIEQLLGGGDPFLVKALEELAIWCVPALNPDGVWAFLQGSARTGRKNGRDHDGDGRASAGEGVDLNRNYPFHWGALGELGSRSLPQSYWYRGPGPASEPEVQAMVSLGRSEQFVAALSYHTGTVAILAPYTAIGLRSPEPDEAWAVAEYIAAQMPPHPEGRTFVARRQLYPVDGTAEDQLRHAHGTVALLLEGARTTPKTEAARQRIVRAIRPSWRLLLSRYLEGPAVYGQVRDLAGQPLVADVAFDGQSRQEGEVWTTRCRDGRFDRFVPTEGRQTLRVRVPGAADVIRSVNVVGRIRVDVTLPIAARPRTCAPTQ